MVKLADLLDKVDALAVAPFERLNRIEGKVRGISTIVRSDRYCVDIVTQISAVHAALQKAEEEILRDRVLHFPSLCLP